MNKFTPVLLSVIFLLSPATGPANTTRDIGEEPGLDWREICEWISFYTNIERVTKGLPPQLYVTALEKAARWQAEYCVKISTLSHYASVTGMRTVRDRVEHFGGRYSAWGENLTVQFRINSEGISYYKKNDEKGEYRDYGNHTIYWRDERQTAHAMVESWMKSPGHRANILKKEFTLLGAGAAEGLYRGEKSFYGCQVFAGDRPLVPGGKAPEKEFSKLAVTGSAAAGFAFKYGGKFKIAIVELDREGKPVIHHAEKTDRAPVLKKNFKPASRIFASLIDPDTGIVYPVKALD